MSTSQQNESASGNQSRISCDHCAAVTSHEPWCIVSNAIVRYAYGIVSRASLLTLGDELILHALGVRWSPRG